MRSQALATARRLLRPHQARAPVRSRLESLGVSSASAHLLRRVGRRGVRELGWHIERVAIRIRPAGVADLDAVMALLKELDESHVELEPSLLHHFDEQPRPTEWLELRFADRHEACLVAEYENQVAGFVWCKSQNPPALPAFIQEPILVVGDLVVHEGLRERGIGRSLLEAAFSWGRARGIRRVQLTVFDRNERAQHFYRELGFRPLSVVLTRDL